MGVINCTATNKIKTMAVGMDKNMTLSAKREFFSKLRNFGLYLNIVLFHKL